MEKENKESGFKLLAIRPLKGCDKRFRKNLNEGEIYQFYQNYQFLDKKGDEISVSKANLNSEVSTIKKTEDEIGLYSDADSDLKINISAIVGKNGSGKSTLLELFFLAVYLVDYKNIIQHKKDTEDNLIFIDKEKSYNDIIYENESYLDNNADGRTRRFFRGLKFFCNKRAHLEVLYEDNSNTFKLIIDTDLKDDIDWYKLENITNKTYDYKEIKPLPFYSISLNYSIHSLNTLDMDVWLESIFHKNDGYQTPLVINPKREEGTIDITNERGLQKSRLLVNTMDIMENSKDIDPLFNNKVIKKIVFKYKDRSYQPRRKRGKDEKTPDKITKIKNIFDLKKYSDCSWIEKETYFYILYKVNRIISNYKLIFNNENNFEDNLKKMINYDSHITFKLKQAINFINNDNYIKTICQQTKPLINTGFYGEGFDAPYFDEDPNINIEILNENDRLATDIYSYKTNEVTEQINYLPPAIFDYDFHFSEGKYDTFERLSSGEKQQVYSIHTIMYHLRNVSSVTEESDIIKYSKINILLDEIELYFHPEMQRHFISRLIKGVEQLKKHLKENINSINILLATHSPFILSDIPSSNILRLNDGDSTRTEQQTFGANIHDLLANDFFLKDGFMGEYANKQIEETITYLNSKILEIKLRELKELQNNNKLDESKKNLIKTELMETQKEFDSLKVKNKNREYHLQLIELIGEPILRNKLSEMAASIMPVENKKRYLEEQFNIMAKNAGVNINDIKFED